MIEVSQFQEAQKVLQDGSGTVCAHGLGWPEDDWQPVTWIIANRGAWFARFHPSKNYTQIDGLQIRTAPR